MKILLFDLDGVLVKPGGYRAALRDTLYYFFRQFALPEGWLPSEQDILTLEGQGITGEWDMIPLSLALALEHSFQIRSPHDLFTTYEEIARWSQDKDGLVDREAPPYGHFFGNLGIYKSPHIPVSEAVYRASIVGEDHHNLFPCLSNHPVFNHLLCTTRDIRSSRTSQIFQNMVIGSEEFQKIHPGKSILSCPSYLAEFDRSLLEEGIRQELLAGRKDSKWVMAAMTARPSIPPIAMDETIAGITPEAEIALKKTGMDSMPLVGYGDLAYMAVCKGLEAESLLKPSPFHALAALGTALGGEKLSCLHWAFEMVSGQNSSDMMAITRQILPVVDHSPLDAFIFEDSKIGVLSLEEASKILIKNGIEITVNKIGIASDPIKSSALEKVGCRVYSNINTAVNQLEL